MNLRKAISNLTIEDIENYKKQLEQSIKINSMAVMTDCTLLNFIERKIKRLKRRS